jgi:hypothetical protein
VRDGSGNPFAEFTKQKIAAYSPTEPDWHSIFWRIFDGEGTPGNYLFDIFYKFVILEIKHFESMHVIIEEIKYLFPIIAVADTDAEFLYPDPANGFAIFERIVFLKNKVFDKFLFEDIFKRFDLFKIRHAFFVIAWLNVDADLRFGIVNEELKRKILDLRVIQNPFSRVSFSKSDPEFLL